MKSIDVYSIGVPPSFGVATDDPGYWTERLSCEVSTMLYNAQLQGMTVSQQEDGDEADVVAAANSILANVQSYFDGVIEADGATGEGQDDLMPPLPEILPVVIACLPQILAFGFNPAGLFALLAAVGLGIVTSWIRSKGSQDGKQYDSSQMSSEALEEVLNKIFDELQMLNDREECLKLSDDTIILWKTKVLRGLT